MHFLVALLACSLPCSDGFRKSVSTQLALRLRAGSNSSQLEKLVIDLADSKALASQSKIQVYLPSLLDEFTRAAGAFPMSSFSNELSTLSARALAELAHLQVSAQRGLMMAGAVYHAHGSPASSLGLVRMGIDVVYETSTNGEKATALIVGLAALGVFLTGLYHIVPKATTYVFGDGLVDLAIRLAMPIGLMTLNLRVRPNATAGEVLTAVRTSAPFLAAEVQLFERQARLPWSGADGLHLPLRSTMSFVTLPQLVAVVPVPVSTSKSINTDAGNTDAIIAYSNTQNCSSSMSEVFTKEVALLRELRKAAPTSAAHVFDTLLQVVEIREELQKTDLFMVGFLRRVVATAGVADEQRGETQASERPPCWAHVSDMQLLSSFAAPAIVPASADEGATQSAVRMASEGVEQLWGKFLEALSQTGHKLREFLAGSSKFGKEDSERIQRHADDIHRRLAELEQSAAYNESAKTLKCQELCIAADMLVRDLVEVLDAVSPTLDLD